MCVCAAMAAEQQRCRICAESHDAGVMIFGSKGHEMMLRDNISKFLHVEVSLDDKLPKMVCIKCCTQIDSIRVFAEKAKQAQKCLEMYEKLNNLDSDDGITYYRVNNGDNEYDCKENDDNSETAKSDDEEDITDMEVSVDPMMFLDSYTDDSQTNDGRICGNDIATISPEEECATLTKIENRPQSLTIELVPMLPKVEFEKRGRALPDLKPIKSAKKFSASENIRPYSCTYCPRSFYTSIALQNHSWLHSHKEGLNAMSNGTKIRCPVCRKDMSTKGNLKVHMESHKPKGKYTCDICGRVFKTQSNLLRHKEYHGGVVFTCNVCGRVYPTNSTLRAHSVTHSDARPHNCPLCKKTFKRNQDLKFHINQHTGARPYRCPYCPKAFASSGNCFSHRKRMHPLEVERDREKTSFDP